MFSMLLPSLVIKPEVGLSASSWTFGAGKKIRGFRGAGLLFLVSKSRIFRVFVCLSFAIIFCPCLTIMRTIFFLGIRMLLRSIFRFLGLGSLFFPPGFLLMDSILRFMHVTGCVIAIQAISVKSPMIRFIISFSFLQFPLGSRWRGLYACMIAREELEL